MEFLWFYLKRRCCCPLWVLGVLRFIKFNLLLGLKPFLEFVSHRFSHGIYLFKSVPCFRLGSILRVQDTLHVIPGKTPRRLDIVFTISTQTPSTNLSFLGSGHPNFDKGMIGGRFMVGAFTVYLVGALLQTPDLTIPMVSFSLDDIQIKGIAKFFYLRLGFIPGAKASP